MQSRQQHMLACLLMTTRSWRRDELKQTCRTYPADEGYDLHAAAILALRREGHDNLASVAGCCPYSVICGTMSAVDMQASVAAASLPRPDCAHVPSCSVDALSEGCSC